MSPKKSATARDRKTTINIPSEMFRLLRRVAVGRSRIAGGRPSVSAVLVSLVERHRKELEKEAKAQ